VIELEGVFRRRSGVLPGKERHNVNERKEGNKGWTDGQRLLSKIGLKKTRRMEETICISRRVISGLSTPIEALRGVGDDPRLTSLRLRRIRLRQRPPRSAHQHPKFDTSYIAFLTSCCLLTKSGLPAQPLRLRPVFWKLPTFPAAWELRFVDQPA
jgi:hypothetical protein